MLLKLIKNLVNIITMVSFINKDQDIIKMNNHKNI